MQEYLLYALAKGDTERWKEELLAVSKTMERTNKIKEIATADGWHSFRVATYAGEAPNFAATVNA